MRKSIFILLILLITACEQLLNPLNEFFATTEIVLSGNLNSDTQALAQVWSADVRKRAEIFSTSFPTSLAINSTNNELVFRVEDEGLGIITRCIEISPATYCDIWALVCEIMNHIAADDSLLNAAHIETVIRGGMHVLRVYTVCLGGTTTGLTLSGSACANLNLPTSKAVGTDELTDLKNVPSLSPYISNGSVIHITGKKPDGRMFDGTFIYGDDGKTVQDFINKMDLLILGTEVSISEEGFINIVDAIEGESETTVLTYVNDNTTGNVVSAPNFILSQHGRDHGEVEIEASIYDSKGHEHHLFMQFRNISTPTLLNIWCWEVHIDWGDIRPISGDRGVIEFNQDGSFKSFSSGDNQPVCFEPGNGAERVTIDIIVEVTENSEGVTQFDSPTTIQIISQNGIGPL